MNEEYGARKSLLKFDFLPYSFEEHPPVLLLVGLLVLLLLGLLLLIL